MVLAAPLLPLLAACAGGDPKDTDPDGSPGDDTGTPTDSATTPDPVDADGDGSPDGEDCDDGDAAIHPGADEHCDGVDEDCDGATDEDPVDGSTWYADADGDSYGDPATATTACTRPPDRTADATDCDDGAATAHPGATEAACTAVDEDCDGLYDEGTDDAAGVLVGGRIYANLQQGFAAAHDGDTVWVCPGVYDSDRIPVYATSIAHLTVAGSARDASRTVFDGEGLDPMFILSGEYLLADLTFRDGRAPDEEGGAVFANGDLTVDRCVFEGNSAYDAGGAISWGYGTRLTIRDSTFTDNYAYGSGGAVYVNGATGWEDWDVSIAGTTFETNRSTGFGGALALGQGAVWSLSVTESTFSANKSGSNGAAIGRAGAASSDTATITIADTTFTGNTPDGSGVVDLWADALDLDLRDTMFSDTVAPRGPALLSVYGDGTWTFTRARFVRGVASDHGAIVSAQGSGSTLVSVESDWGTGADTNDGIDLLCQCGVKDALGADASFTCTGDGTWTE